MSSDSEIDFPQGTSDERELLVRWLGYLRGAVIRKVEGLSDTQVRWTPDGALTEPCLTEPGADLRWVMLHLINETARHAGHADATRELLDGQTGE